MAEVSKVMSDSWYQKCMPLIKEVEPHLSNIVKSIRNLEGINYLYVWGSCFENKDTPDFRVKDIDIIVETDFNSGDLISINNEIIKQNNSSKYLEEQGFYPPAVKFSQEFMDLHKYNVDHWAISADKKLLHWGPMLVNKEESEGMNKEAENYASIQTGYNRKKINKSSENVRNNWYKIYNDYIEKQLSDMPSGWYMSENAEIKEILQKAMKI